MHFGAHVENDSIMLERNLFFIRNFQAQVANSMQITSDQSSQLLDFKYHLTVSKQQSKTNPLHHMLCKKLKTFYEQVELQKN